MMTKELVKKILEQPYQYKWSIQGLGMLRLYLGDVHRLHIWNSNFAVPDVSKVHTHPWNFESYVVAGEVQNQISSEVEGEPTHFKQSIFCGVGGGLKGDPVKVRLEETKFEVLGEGQSYKELAHEIHVSVPLDGTVTIIKREYLADSDHAYVYWEEGDWVSAEPRSATIEEIENITQYSLAAWFND